MEPAGSSSKNPSPGGIGGDADISLGHALCCATLDDPCALQKQGPIAKRRNRCRVMTHEDHGVSSGAQGPVSLLTARLEPSVAHREDLVEDENFPHGLERH